MFLNVEIKLNTKLRQENFEKYVVAGEINSTVKDYTKFASTRKQFSTRKKFGVHNGKMKN